MIFNPDIAREFLSWAMVDPDMQLGELRLIALQGVTPVGGTPTIIGTNQLVENDNAPDKQNDAIILLYREPLGAWGVSSLVGTTEPGRYYTQTDPHPQGASHLTYGEHLFVAGDHKHDPKLPGLRGKNGTNRVWRDKNGNFKLDFGEFMFEGAFGNNVHAGSKTEYIGQNSAGCLNIGGGWTGAPYAEFLHLRRVHMEHKIPDFRVLVWRGSDLFRYRSPGHRPTLYTGMLNGWVAVLQRQLTVKGFPLVDDGDWGNKTTQVVAAFQKQAGLAADAIVGPATWTKLYAA